MRRPFAVVAVLATVATLPAPASAADPSWQRLDVPFAFLPQVVTLTALPGRQAMVYYHNPVGEPSQNHGTRIVERTPGTGFSAPQEIGGNAVTASGFADNGDAVIVDNGYPGTSTGFRPAGGPPLALTAFGADHDLMAVDVDPAGKALGAVRTTGGKLRVTDRPAGSGSAFATPVQTQNDEAATRAFGVLPPYLAVALDPNGAAAVAFGSTGDQVKTVTRAAGGSFGAAVNAPTPAGTFPTFAANRAGDAVLMWKEGAIVKSSFRPRGGAFGAAQIVQTLTENRVADAHPAAAIDGNGRVFAAWPTSRTGTYTCDPLERYRMFSAFRDTAGTWSVKPDRPGQFPVVAAADTTDMGGRFVLAYTRVDPRLTGCPDLSARRVVAEVGTYDTVPVPAVLPAQQADDEGVYHNAAAAAVTPAGDAVVAYDTDENDGEAAAFEVPAAGEETDDEDESPVAKPEEKPVIPGDGGANNAPLGFQGSGPSGARGPDVGSHQVGGTLQADPRIFSPVPPPVRVSQLNQGIPLTLSCAVACGITVTGQVQTGSGGSARAAKVSRVRLEAMTVRLKAGERRKVRVKLPKKAVSAIRRAVRKRQRAVAVLTITAPGAKPKTLTVKFRR